MEDIFHEVDKLLNSKRTFDKHVDNLEYLLRSFVDFDFQIKYMDDGIMVVDTNEGYTARLVKVIDLIEDKGPITLDDLAEIGV